jgi:sugar phosphate permease
MQNVLGYSAIKAGLSYLPLAVSIIIAAGVASQLVTKVGFKPILAIGMLLISGGLLWFGQISPDGGFLTDVLGPSLLAAVGLGFAFVPQTIAAVSGVAAHAAGLASGLINTTQQVGGALGLAVLSTVAFPQIDDAAAASGGQPSLSALTDGYADAFMVGSAIAFLGVLATLFLIRTRDSRAHVELGAPEPEPSAA